MLRGCAHNVASILAEGEHRAENQAAPVLRFSHSGRNGSSDQAPGGLDSL